jgi:hypothetical protein
MLNKIETELVIGGKLETNKLVNIQACSDRQTHTKINKARI